MCRFSGEAQPRVRDCTIVICTAVHSSPCFQIRESHEHHDRILFQEAFEHTPLGSIVTN